MKPIELDGRTGEGGGQLVRLAVALSALTSQPLRITNIRGNRPGSRGGGLKSQHFAAIKWLADATEADVQGLAVGSRTLTFSPRRPPTAFAPRSVCIHTDSEAASVLLVAQAVLPFLLYAANDAGQPIVLELSGGTNVSFSLSYEYFDQVLLPTLEDSFGVRVERELKVRGWSLGPLKRGSVLLTVHPVPKGEKLRWKESRYVYPDSYAVKSIDVSIIAPKHAHSQMQNALARDLDACWPDVDVNFRVIEDSGHRSRWAVLLVAHSRGGIRWARDVLKSAPKKPPADDQFITQLCKKLCKELHGEVSLGGQVDEHLQDQLICFQALCDGTSALTRGGGLFKEDMIPPSTHSLGDVLGKFDMKNEMGVESFGRGSMHTKTARWVASEMLPGTIFHKDGDIVKGVGLSYPG